MVKVRRVYKIILDTNFLVDIVRFKVDLDSVGELVLGKYKLIMPEAVEKELKKMKTKHAKSALKISKLKKLKTVSDPRAVKGADNIIVAIAEELFNKKSKVAVATNDAKLRKRLKGLGAKTIYLRARKHLEIS